MGTETGVVMELRPYQQKAVEWMCEHERGLVVAPAGSGKTIIAAAAIRAVAGASPDVVKPLLGWICNTKEQRHQALAALESTNCYANAQVIVECAAQGKDWSEYNGQIVDEAHHATAPMWKKQIESCKGVRWGFTATPWGRDRSRNQQLLDMFGGNVYVIDRSEVGGNLAPARVVWLDACDDGLPERIEAETEKVLKQRMRFRRYQMMSPQQARGEVAWGVCCEYGIFRNDERNWLALHHVIQHDEPTLILCSRVEHAQQFAALCLGYAVWSGMPTKERAKAINGFRSGEIRRLVATTLADEGFDAPCAEVLVLLSGGRNEARTVQRSGRVLRPHPGKTEATIYDFKDTAIPLMHRHAMKRAAIYEKLGYAGAELDPQPGLGV